MAQSEQGETHDGREPPADPPEAAVYDIAVRLGVLGLIIYLSLLVIEPFALLVLWAAILTVALFPVHGWLSARFGGRGKLASALITLIGLAVVLGPIAALGLNLVETSQLFVGELQGGTLELPPLPAGVRDLPVVGERVFDTWHAASTSLEDLLRAHKETILSVAGAVIGTFAQIGGGILFFIASIVMSGFLFGPGPQLAEAGRRFARRIFGERGAQFVDLAGATIRNVSRGVVGVAVLQTLLAGIGLIIAGVPAAGLLCIIMLVLCIVQIGPALVIVPLLVWTWYTMDTGAALLFTVYMIPVMVLDNFLKPLLMSKGLETPMLVILVGAIGGSFSYGLIGLFVRPGHTVGDLRHHPRVDGPR